MGHTASQGDGHGNGNGRGKISAAEVALYDRQIRLWGMDAQSRMRGAHVLLVGFRGLGNEVAKNLILAGIGAMTLLDDGAVARADLTTQFFQEEADLGARRVVSGAARLQSLNPRVRVHGDTQRVHEKDDAFFGKFDTIVCMDQPFPSLACRAQQRAFYAASTFGLQGYIFADLVQHQYVIERLMGNQPSTAGQESTSRQILAVESRKQRSQTMEVLHMQESYIAAETSLLHSLVGLRPKEKKRVSPILAAVRALWQLERMDSPVSEFVDTLEHELARNGIPNSVQPGFAETFLQDQGVEMAPVTAVVGGILAQDVLNIISKREQPIQNWFVFDGNTGEGAIYHV